MTETPPHPAVARPAATVVVLREGASASAPFEVLLLRRNDKVAFMAGAYVFPGGRVDEADRRPMPGVLFVSTPSRFADLTVDEELVVRIAAVRELAEEADLHVVVDDLVPFAHWVTPELEIRRYDTRFFLALLPVGQTATHDGGETTAQAWLSPAAALAQARSGSIRLPPPTWTTLRRLELFDTVQAALAWAKSTRIVCVQPGFHTSGATSMIVLPGDPLFPTIDGWEIPEETRFILQDGNGWLPTRRAETP